MKVSITYNKIWKKLIDFELTKTGFQREIEISTSTLAKLSNDQYVSMDVLVRICVFFNCQLSDICEIKVKDEVEFNDIKQI